MTLQMHEKRSFYMVLTGLKAAFSSVMVHFIPLKKLPSKHGLPLPLSLAASAVKGGL